MKMLPMFGMIFLIYYFLVIKPEQQKLRSHNELMVSLKKGDQVVTSGGIMARVAAIEDDCIVLDLGNSARLKVEKSHVSKRKQKEEAAAA